MRTGASAAAMFLVLSASAFAAAIPVDYKILARGGTNSVGIKPYSGLVFGPDGNYYGTATDGGAYGGGTIFKLTPDGVLTNLVSFPRKEGNPSTTLIVGSDGNLYGTTDGAPAGTADAKSTIFRTSLSGVLETLAAFPNGNPAVAPSKLIQASDGNYYGTTARGGAQQKGSIFRLASDGTLTTLFSFSGAEGTEPRAGLVEGDDGNFYGTTKFGGGNNGTAFRVTSGGELTVLYSFGPNNVGLFPAAELLKAPDGNFYGVTSSGSTNFGGAAFKMTPAGSITFLAALPSNNVTKPSPLTLGDDGNFYGTTVSNFYRITPAGDLTVLVDFEAAFDGRGAEGPLLKIGNGQFLQGTYAGGTANLNEFGTIQRLTEAGEASTVVAFPRVVGRGFNSELTQGPDARFYGTVADDLRNSAFNFTTAPGAFAMTGDGEAVGLANLRTSKVSPFSSAVVQSADGDLYGAISDGGRLTSAPPPGIRAAGFIYRIRPTGSISTVFQFVGDGGSSPNQNGDSPVGRLTRGPNEELYGTTLYGGAKARGTFFKIGANRVLTTLASFDSSTGMGPTGDLIYTDGVFYGVTSFGGANNTGTFFKVSPEGQITSLASFAPGQPVTVRGHLILARDGTFYAGTGYGGANNVGAILRLTKAGVLSTFASMDSVTGSAPLGVVEAKDGYLYGVTLGTTTESGGIFRVDSSGGVKSLLRFDEARGTTPLVNLTVGADGALYGCTATGGPSSGGVTYRLALPQIGITAIEKLPDKNIRLHGIGVPSEVHTVRAAEDLSQTFVPIGTKVADELGAIYFDDTDAATHARRFYRILYP